MGAAGTHLMRWLQCDIHTKSPFKGMAAVDCIRPSPEANKAMTPRSSSVLPVPGLVVRDAAKPSGQT